MAINGNDTNKVIVTAKVKDGAVNGTSTSTIKIKYTYDEGSCPEGEILSEDESMCLCPEGKVRNELGICIEPPKPIECADDEIYNEEKKICEKKVVPVEPDDPVEPEPTPEPEKEEVKPTPITPSNPKTLDNIILVTVLFLVSGIGIYAVLFRKLKNNKEKISAAVAIGVVTFTLSFTVLAGVFGIDNLLSAIINPITKNTELVVTVNEKIDMVITWDGYCSKPNLTPEEIFEGGSGTESDPYQVKTADQLACFAKSVNEGTTYEGNFVKQIKDIKLNDNLNDNIEAGTTDGLHEWTPIGDSSNSRSFNGTYDGDNHIVSGVYIKDDTLVNSSKGLFGYVSNATLKNITISDAYFNSSRGSGIGVLLGTGVNSLVVDNVTAYGNHRLTSGYNYFNVPCGGLIGSFNGKNTNGGIRIENTTNYVNNGLSGVINRIQNVSWSEEPNIIFTNVTNNGFVSFTGGLAFVIEGEGNVLVDNCANTGDVYSEATASYQAGGLFGDIHSGKLTIKNSYNSGDVSNYFGGNTLGGIGGILQANRQLVIEKCFNSGNVRTVAPVVLDQVKEGATIDEFVTIKGAAGYSSYNDARVAGIVADAGTNDNILIKDTYNTGEISGLSVVGGIIAHHYYDNIVYDNVYNEGEIIVGSYSNAGGIAGYTNGIIRNSHNSGTITIWSNRYGGYMSGGLIGWGKAYAPSTTGAVDAVIENSYNEGDIIVNAKFYKADVAGLCAKCASITDSSSSGNINIKYATQSYDGIRLEGSGAVTNTSFTGTINLQNLSY